MPVCPITVNRVTVFLAKALYHDQPRADKKHSCAARIRRNIATMRLFAEYEMIIRAVEQGVDAKYEPYYAFGLTVPLIWLYLEILHVM